MKPIDEKHESKRRVLRTAGLAVLALGGLCMLIAFVDFFTAFGGYGPPRFFWLFFVGAPLLFVGGVMTSMGFMGAMARYQAGEAAPVMKDTFNYMAEGTQDGVKTVASAVSAGLREGLGAPPAASVRCPKCNHLNGETGRFCSQCGFSLAKTKPCPQCRELNDPDAKFCDACGRQF